MNSLNPFINLPTLEQVMHRSPILVAPDIPLIEAISLMSPAYRSEDPNCDRSPLNQREGLFNSSILVTEGLQLVGILTERDVLRFIGSNIDFLQAEVAQVMTHPVITLSPQQDILTAWSLMRQHQIRHLPMINEQGQVLGQINQSDIFQWVDPVALFQEIRDRGTLQCDDEGISQQTEEKLQQMSIALSNAVEGISQLDTQGRYLEVNQAYANMVGYEPEDMIGMAWQSTVHPDDIDSMMTAYQQMLDTGRVEAEVRGIRKDGSTFYKQLTMVASYQEQQLTGHYCFMKDITDSNLVCSR
jgi:hypothetical protein